MKRTLLATATSLFLWTSPTWARAQEENLFDRLDANKDGQIAADEVDGERRRLFERLVRNGDKNSDGKLSREEFTEATKERPVEPAPADRPNLPEPRELFSRFDRNGDGKLSKEEAPERLRENFERMDANSDGGVDLDELRQAFAAMARRGGPPGAPGRPGPEMLERLFQERDANKDGKLTKDELPAERQESFARMLERFDDDGDGALTKEQFLRALQAFQERRGDGNGRRPEGDRKPEGERKPDPSRRPEGDGKPEGTPRPAGERRPDGDRKPDSAGRPAGEGRPGGRPSGAPGFAPPLFVALDTNRDGELTSDEIERAAEALRSLDKNKDGKLTRDELAPNR